MFGFDEAQDNYNQVQQGGHKAELSHEIVAGGASFFAVHEFEEHQRKEGKTVNHEFAKELIAGFAGAEVDRLAETKGGDYFDKEKAKHEAKHKAKKLYDEHYGDEQNYNPERKKPHPRIQESFGDNY